MHHSGGLLTVTLYLVERGFKVLESWEALLEKLRAEGLLHERSLRSTPLKAVLEDSSDPVRSGRLEAFAALKSWYKLRLAAWDCPQDYHLTMLGGDTVAVFDQLTPERTATEKAELTSAVHTYVLEMIRTFTFHSYLRVLSTGATRNSLTLTIIRLQGRCSLSSSRPQSSATELL